MPTASLSGRRKPSAIYTVRLGRTKRTADACPIGRPRSDRTRSIGRRACGHSHPTAAVRAYVSTLESDGQGRTIAWPNRTARAGSHIGRTTPARRIDRTDRRARSIGRQSGRRIGRRSGRWIGRQCGRQASDGRIGRRARAAQGVSPKY